MCVNKYRVFIFYFVFFYLICSSPAISNSTIKDDSLAILHFKKGEACILQGDTSRAIQEFKEAVRQNYRFSDAFHRLAQLYLDLGALEDRVQARKFLKQALRFEPKNVNYLHTQLELFLRIRFYWSATRVAKKIIKIDPKDEKAYFILGRLSEQEYLRYRDMINPVGQGIHLSGFAIKDLEKALEYYRQSIEANSQFSDGYYRLAFLCYEAGLLDRMVNLLREAMNVDPENKDYHLFLGIAYHKMRQYHQAWEEYEQAKSFMHSEELAIFESVDMILTPDEMKAYRLVSAEKKEQIQRRFWKQRDPLFITEMNERKLEHYGRIAYANLRFSSIQQGIEGWKTDMGNIYIRYGQPFGRKTTWPNTTNTMIYSESTDIGSFPIYFSKSVWSYPGFSIEFEDWNLDGRYEFYYPRLEEKEKMSIDMVLNKQPERYDFMSPAKQFTISCRFASFRDGDDRTVLEVYQSIPQEIDPSTKDREDHPLKRGVFVFDRDWNEVQKEVVENPFFTSLENTLSVGWSRLKAPPGDYHLVVEYFDENEGKIGRWLNEVTVEAYDKRTLSMSDLVLAWEIGDYQEEGELRRGGLRIVPNTLGKYSVISTIPIYFEIYNLTYSLEGSTHYRLTYTVESEEKKGGIGGFIGKLFGRGEQSGKVVTSYEYQGAKRFEKTYQNLTLQGALPNKYKISIEVEDLNTKQKVARQKEIQLAESSVAKHK